MIKNKIGQELSKGKRVCYPTRGGMKYGIIDNIVVKNISYSNDTARIYVVVKQPGRRLMKNTHPHALPAGQAYHYVNCDVKIPIHKYKDIVVVNTPFTSKRVKKHFTCV